MSQESQEPGQRDDDGLNDAWLQTEMHDLFLARETTPALSQAALDDAIQTLKAGEPLSLPQAFDLLQQAQLDDMRILSQIPVRATASPFIPSLGSAYIVCRRLCRDDQTSASLDAQQQQEAISVTFQSVLNSEVWWSKDVPGLGVAARPMGRNIRTWKKSKDKDAKADAGIERETHGYRGRLYTLVAKKSDPAESKLRQPQPAIMTQPAKEAQLPSSAQPLAALSRETSAVDSARLMGFVAQPTTDTAAVASAFAPVKKEGGVGPIPATQEQPSSPISPSQAPPGSPTRSSSPTRGSKRPRATTGAQLGPNERCIAVGDIGIVQVWRPRSAMESPRGKVMPVTFSSQPASPAPAGEHGAVPHGFGHFPPGAPPSGVSLIPQSAVTYHHQSGTSSSMHADAPAEETQPRRAPPESAGSAASHMGPFYETNDVVLNGTLRVRGDIYAEGRIFGKFVTPPMAADYAEFFEWDPSYLHQGGSVDFREADVQAINEDCVGKVAPTDDDKVDQTGMATAVAADDIARLNTRTVPPPGSVVQLRSPQQTLTLNTNGNGPCLVVSTSPSVAAGVPFDTCEVEKGALVAFVGQVPVRCRGQVETGDYLVPSGLCDGCAVSTRSCQQRHHNFNLVGVAMHGSNARDDEEVSVLCLVRWDMAIKRKALEMLDEAVGAARHAFVRISAVVGLVAAWCWLVCKATWLVLFATLDLYLSSTQKAWIVADDVIEAVVAFCSVVNLFVIILLLVVLRMPVLLQALPAIATCWAFFVVLAFVHTVLKQVMVNSIDHQTRLTFDAVWSCAGFVYHSLVARALSRLRVVMQRGRQRDAESSLRHAAHMRAGYTPSRSAASGKVTNEAG